MLQRSKGVPLTVLSYGPVSKGAYDVLYQVLASHLHRVEELFLDTQDDPPFSVIAEHQDQHIRPNELREILQLLGQQHNGPLKLKRLRLAVEYPDNDTSPFIVPDGVITASPSLKYLALRALGINWGLQHTFHNLRTLRIIFIPEEFLPSMTQLLRLLSQMPLLSTLYVDDISPYDEVLPSHEDMVLHMRYLEDIQICCESLPILNSFFDLVKFSEGVNNLVCEWTIDDAEEIEELFNEPNFVSFPQNLTRKMDNATDGLITKVSISMLGIRCWKSKGRRDVSFFPEKLSVIEVQYGNFAPSKLIAPLLIRLLEGLRLEELVSFELDARDHIDDSQAFWTFIGHLPHIKQFKIIGSKNLGDAIVSLPTFPALTTLAIANWNFEDTLEDPWPPNTTAIDALLYCAKLRAWLKVPLKLLQMENCSGCGEKHLSALRNLVDEVVLNDEDLEEEEDCIYVKLGCTN
ncbi:hypothetical protein H0H92_013501 [Tricholoma furcatifolium]|nr:hypothetical protein H0H92_013501 [Tricholoma furcatifolium]